MERLPTWRDPMDAKSTLHCCCSADKLPSASTTRAVETEKSGYSTVATVRRGSRTFELENKRARIKHASKQAGSGKHHARQISPVYCTALVRHIVRHWAS
jgi:hypothetical protein